jgi:hypothetical protein
VNHRSAAAAETSAAAVLADPQATWYAGKAPAGEFRAVERQGGDAWARAKLEVAGGGRERGTAPAAGGTRRQSREQRRQEEEGGKNETEDCFAISEKGRDLTIKSLQLLNQCPNGDGPKSKSA